MVSQKKFYAVYNVFSGKFLRRDERRFGPLDPVNSYITARKTWAEMRVADQMTEHPNSCFRVVEVRVATGPF